MNEHHHQGRSSEQLVDKAAILTALNIRPGWVILDAGCGDGYMARAFAQAMNNTGIVHAIDPDETAIAGFSAADAARCNIRPMVGDITAPTPLAETSIDLVFLCAVVHGFSPDQMAGFCDEVVRILKPDGQLAIVEIDKRDTPFGPPMDLRYSPDELAERIPLTPMTVVRAGEYFYMQVFNMSA